MARATLDPTDLTILKILQSSGRTSNVDLARQVGISAPPCLRRVRRLEEIGAIRAYHADIAPDMLGYPVTAFTHVGLISQAEVDLDAFEVLTKSWPEVRECHMLMGEDDFLLKVVALTVDHYNSFIRAHIGLAAAFEIFDVFSSSTDTIKYRRCAAIALGLTLPMNRPTTTLQPAVMRMLSDHRYSLIWTKR